ncbi:MAG: Na/Pi cotransporter family protein [Spirochaetales bacterium]|nr:Na/Pi cotransporter family protein [Spirochaetales bacterium]
MISGFFQIAGSLGLFLYGMNIMSDGIQKTAGEKLHSVLNFMTKNRVMAVITGFLITGLIQSSSATTVMAVSFVNAQLLTLTQSIGVIMGANIGTTVTGWIVALLGFKFKISAIAIPIIGIGMPLFFSKKLGKKDLGQALIGFGILFLGLTLLKDSVPDIKAHPEILEFLSDYTGFGFGSFLIFVLVGTLLTVVVQSSSAAMAITLTMANAGWIDFGTAAAIVLGENIGTTVTAYLASIGTSVNARRASRAHLLFNVLGVVWMAILFKPFIGLVEMVVPGELTGPEGIPARLAMFHTLFNVINTLIWIGFVNFLAKIVIKLVPDKEELESNKYEFKYISAGIQETPEINILNAKSEVSKMANIVKNMYTEYLQVFKNPDKKMGDKITLLKEQEDYTDQMQEQLSSYLVEVSRENLNESSALNVAMLMRTVNELESVGDSIYNLSLLAQRRYDKAIDLDPIAVEEILPYADRVTKFLDFITKHLDSPLSAVEMEKARKIERKIDKTRNTLNKSARKRLRDKGNIKSELMIIDIVRHMEHIGDYLINIAESLRHDEVSVR